MTFIVMSFEELKEEFKNNGFQIDGDSFVFEKVEYNTINVNGQVYKQPHKTRFELKYICEGCIKDVTDESDCNETPIYEFDIMDGNEPVLTVCIENLEDLQLLSSL